MNKVVPKRLIITISHPAGLVRNKTSNTHIRSMVDDRTLLTKDDLDIPTGRSNKSILLDHAVTKRPDGYFQRRISDLYILSIFKCQPKAEHFQD